MAIETKPQPSPEGMSAEDIQQLTQQGFATRARDKILSAIFRGVIPDVREFSEDERQRFWSFFPLTKDDEGTLLDADEMFSDERLHTACQNARASRKHDRPITSSPYELAKQHVLQQHHEELEQRSLEEGMWDAYVRLGKLPSPQQLNSNPILHGLYVEQSEKYIQRQEELGTPLTLDGAAKAWDEAKRLFSQHLIEQSKKARGEPKPPEITAVSDENRERMDLPVVTGRRERGIKLGTEARVCEMHRLLKQGMSQRQAKARSHCDPSTYHRWCRQATGEDPIEPYR